uniref:DRBM domain-containing protein n=1 Tax=Accipiter nisus TaxID=211598 RepID=A0A8B9MPL3_9AVES
FSALNPGTVINTCQVFMKSHLMPSISRKTVVKESGPPHMKSFVTRVTVGEFTAEGEGNSKKLSKKRAAMAVLQELKKLPPLPQLCTAI